MTTASARTIEIEILDKDGRAIVSVDPPAGNIPTAKLLEVAFPNCAIEHVGRRKLLAIGPRIGAPTSLFFRALGFAFDHHHALALSPEVLGYLLNHEIAETVRRHPDHYRALFTTKPAGKTEIAIRDDTLMPGRSCNWGAALAKFEAALCAHVPDGIIDAMLPSYSTYTLESRVAALITFMDAASPFYTFRVVSFCGIPRVRLLGVPDDWRKLRQSGCKLAEQFAAHLGPYFQRLLPVLTKLAEQADPSVPVDNEFWTSIYMRRSASGSDSVSGWITAFVQYSKDPKTGALQARERSTVDAPHWSSACAEPIEHDRFAMHLSRVPFAWSSPTGEHSMYLVAGVLGLDAREGFVTPALSYAVVHA